MSGFHAGLYEALSVGNRTKIAAVETEIHEKSPEDAEQIITGTYLDFEHDGDINTARGRAAQAVSNTKGSIGHIRKAVTMLDSLGDVEYEGNEQLIDAALTNIDLALAAIVGLLPKPDA